MKKILIAATALLALASAPVEAKEKARESKIEYTPNERPSRESILLDNLSSRESIFLLKELFKEVFRYIIIPPNQEPK